MYAHARQVAWGIFLCVLFIGISTVVALVDPWNNGIPWVNWLSLSAISTGMDMGDGLDPAYHGLAWSIYAAFMPVYILAVLVQYLAAASVQSGFTTYTSAPYV